jgi:ribosomal protein S18 acetylase RimI-like enzyme
MTQLEITVRELALGDIAELTEMDHSYHTDFVWQMDIQSLDNQVNVRFRETRLPRSMRVEYPRDAAQLAEDWKIRDGVLVAEHEESPVGYLSLSRSQISGLITVTDLVVLRRLRRHGIGSSLLRAAQTWASERDSNQLMMEMQSKNYPAICLANKLGYEFCGYSDRYYPNQDIALFFARRF